jgi:hypothetical protein
MLYSKNGSIPKPETDGTEGWIEVPDAPECPEGKEVVWWYPPGWIIRDPKPWADCSWSQSEERWVEFSLPQEISELTTTDLPTITSSEVQALTSEQISGL